MPEHCQDAKALLFVCVETVMHRCEDFFSLGNNIVVVLF